MSLLINAVSNYAAVKDATTELGKEASALDMVQSEHTKYAVMRGALTTQFKEESASGMGQ